MASSPPTRKERDANLDSLEQSVKRWAKVELDRLDNEAKFMRSVLVGRGSSDAGTKNLEAASELLQVEIDDFVVGT
jgi:hypothetical protein